MTPDRYARAAALFAEAESLGPRERTSYLDRACAHDPQLRDDVESLLAETGDQDDAFADARMGGPASGGAAALAAEVRRVADAAHPPRSPAERRVDVPDVIARYSIVRIVGEGGMGRVYEAWQDNPRRRVAIKVVRPDLDSPAVARRFALEAEILGALRHPAIAQIYEASSYSDHGREHRFLAMEFVEGESLLAFADSRRLGPRERIALLAAVCDGVEHAHIHGCVHRDLKPGNILVDAEGRPRVLDFGVARLVGDAEPARTVMTQSGQAIGTIAYMSPEQLAGASDDVDVRSDVWALGVIAHELLTGKLPYEVSGVSVLEAARRITDTDPTRLGVLRRELRGDIETIVLKCLEKDRSRRYPSAGALAADLRRFLADEPVQARPPSAVYQFSKFARRNRGLVVGMGVAALALIIGAGVAAWQAVVAGAARRQAQQDAARAASVAEILFDTFTSSISTRTGGSELTVRQALENAAHRLETNDFDSPPTPDAEAVVRHALGMVYRDAGRLEDAERECRRSLELRRANLPPGHPQIAAGARALAIVLKTEGRAAEAIPLYREELAILRAHGSQREIGQCMHNLASALISTDGPDRDAALREADAILAESIPLHRKMLGPDDDVVGMELSLVARLRKHQQRPADALAPLQEGVAIFRRNHPDGHPTLAVGINELGTLYLALNRPADAEPPLREALAMLEKIYHNPRHPFVESVRANLVKALRMQGKSAEADALRAPREQDELPKDKQ